MIELAAVSKSYDGAVPRRLFERLSVRFAAGEYVAIVGASGIGKSTLLNLIAGLERADSGSIVVDGIDYARCDDDALTALRRARMGFVFQAFHVLPHLTLEQNVALPLLLNRMPHGRALEMLESVGLGGRGGDFPSQLSGGELQRVAIARALVHRPALVLADEPTGNLDPETAESILTLFRSELKVNNACAVMVTHSHAAAEQADQTIVLTKSGLANACAR